MINSADLYQQRKVSPDLGVWVQWYAIYMGIICSRHPDWLPDLLGYLCQICHASEHYRWPSWVVFGQTFANLWPTRVTGSSLLHPWTPRYSPSALMDRIRRANPGATTATRWTTLRRGVLKDPGPQSPSSWLGKSPNPCTTSNTAEICNNYNSLRGCKFAKKCRRLHKCSGCGGAHS